MQAVSRSPSYPSTWVHSSSSAPWKSRNLDKSRLDGLPFYCNYGTHATSSCSLYVYFNSRTPCLYKYSSNSLPRPPATLR